MVLEIVLMVRALLFERGGEVAKRLLVLSRKRRGVSSFETSVLTRFATFLALALLVLVWYGVLTVIPRSLLSLAPAFSALALSC